MKNYIKIITILGIVTFVFTAYTMEETYSYAIEKNESGGKNPLLHVNNFRIKASHGYPAWKPISDGNPICTAEGLVPILAGSALLIELDNVEKEKILEEVRDAVGKGVPLTCNYIVMPNSLFFLLAEINIQLGQNPTSVFQSIENLFGDLRIINTSSRGIIDNKILLIQAILQGCDKREENFIKIVACMDDIPRELASLIAWYLPKCYTSTEDKELIKQARKKLNEEQFRLKLLYEAKQLLLNLEEEEQCSKPGRGIKENFPIINKDKYCYK